jgi:inorganic triphosphatase YgiF
MPAPATETELKFPLDSDAMETLLEHPGLQGEEQRDRLGSVYFDTRNQDLRQCGIGLRVRETGKGFIQTVKQVGNGGDTSRSEWEAQVSGREVDPDALAGTPAGEALDGKLERLAPVFSTTVERTSRLVRREGALIEVSFDVGEVSTGEASKPICELELELKEGDAAALFGLGRALARDACISLSFMSKAERGYRLADETTLDPRIAEAPRLRPDTPTAQAFQQIARGCLAQATGNAELLRAVLRPEALHQMRVGLRRLRAAFAAFRPMLQDDDFEHVDSELKWLAGELDPARDLDVFIHELFMPAAAQADERSFAHLGRQLLAAQSAAYDRASAALRSQRQAVLLIDVAAWIETGPWLGSDDAVLAELRRRPIAGFAADALDHLRKVVRRRGRDLEHLDPMSRHRLRVRAKRLRYASEFFAPLFKASGRKAFLATLKRMQDELGALNDVAMARERLPRLAKLDKECTLAAGRMIGRAEVGEAKRQRKAAKRFEAFRKSEPFWR